MMGAYLAYWLAGVTGSLWLGILLGLPLVSFVIAGTLAGLAGFLQGAHTGYINPAYMAWHESGVVIAIVILGGMGTLYGPILGAFIVVLLQHFLPELTDHWQLLFGAIIIAVVLFLPHGATSLLSTLFKGRSKAEVAAADPQKEEGS